MCSAERVGRFISGGLLKLAASMQNTSVAGPAKDVQEKTSRGWLREFITRLCFLAVSVMSSSTAAICVPEQVGILCTRGG